MGGQIYSHTRRIHISICLRGQVDDAGSYIAVGSFADARPTRICFLETSSFFCQCHLLQHLGVVAVAVAAVVNQPVHGSSCWGLSAWPAWKPLVEVGLSSKKLPQVDAVAAVVGLHRDFALAVPSLSRNQTHT